MLDIKRVLTEHKIFWIDQGNNVQKGNINIQCPICGPNDRSQHLGIRLTDGFWACWRNSKHSSKNINRLLALLNIYIEEERDGLIQSLVNRTFFGQQEVQSNVVVVEPKRLNKLPTEFIPIDEETFFTKPYLNYLRSRGFNDPLQVCQDYDLRFSIGADKWHLRLLMPVWIGDEVTWTGRAINDNSLRYLSPKIGEARNIKTCISNYNELLKTEGDAIIIVEGPVDFLWLDSLFKEQAIRATSLFGLSIPEPQIRLLHNICPNFKKVLIGLDQGTLSQSLQLVKQLSDFGPIIMRLPEKDFNEMTPVQCKELLDTYLNEN